MTEESDRLKRELEAIDLKHTMALVEDRMEERLDSLKANVALFMTITIVILTLLWIAYLLGYNASSAECCDNIIKEGSKVLCSSICP